MSRSKKLESLGNPTKQVNRWHALWSYPFVGSGREEYTEAVYDVVFCGVSKKIQGCEVPIKVLA